MDLKQQEYLVAIADCENITKAAEQLYLTPSALNQQLLKLERELGLQLFIRSHHRVTPTPAGEIYISGCRQMLAVRQQTYTLLQDLKDQKIGSYEIGLTFEHGRDMFAKVYPAFHAEYPGISIHCRQLMTQDMLDMLRDGRLDIAFILTGYPQLYQGVDYLDFSQENLLLGLPITHPLVDPDEPTYPPAKAIDLRQLEHDDFSTALSNSTMRSELIDPLFQRAGFRPNIVTESSYNSFLEQTASMGLCSTIIPQSQVHDRTNIAWYYLPHAPQFHFGAAYPKGYQLSRAMQRFIELARSYAQEYLQFGS